MDGFQLISILLIFFWSIYRFFIQNKKPSTRRNLPPSPPKLPIIGNLHQLNLLPHQDLYSLAKVHGPLMLLRLGNAPVLVVSSADTARQVMRSHDTIFASRPHTKAFKKLLYGCIDISTSPYGGYWRQMKSMAVLHLLSNARVKSFRTIREEETAIFVEKVRECCTGPVDLSAMFASFANDGICRAALGKKYSGSETGEKFVRGMTEVNELIGVLNIGDYIPWLDWINRITGFHKRLDSTAKDMDEVLESMIEERLQFQKESINGDDNYLDILLQTYKDGTVDRNGLKGVLSDVFVGGTDTVSAALEWTMAELLGNPKSMEKLQSEIRGIVKEREEITDYDLEKMHYLKAVIKETLRIHPPAPLLVPRICTKDVQINGFDISVGTVVLINAWAIGRDPVSWDEPLKFKPERFLDSSINFKGQDFEFIPFGAGRRSCPGISFAAASMELMLANLLQKFDWKLGNGVEGKDLDMSETFGLAAHKALPLLAVAVASQS